MLLFRRDHQYYRIDDRTVRNVSDSISPSLAPSESPFLALAFMPFWQYESQFLAPDLKYHPSPSSSSISNPSPKHLRFLKVWPTRELCRWRIPFPVGHRPLPSFSHSLPPSFISPFTFFQHLSSMLYSHCFLAPMLLRWCKGKFCRLIAHRLVQIHWAVVSWQ